MSLESPSSKPVVSENPRLLGYVAALRACPLFGGLAGSELQDMAGIVQLRRLAKDAYLFREGDPAEGFFVVRSGTINVHRVGPGGREQVIHIFRPGQCFAEIALVSPGGYPADARAVIASDVLLVPKEAFLVRLRQRPELALSMLASMSQHLRVLVGAVEDLTQKDVETRLGVWLLERCPRPLAAGAHTIQLPVSKGALAAELSTRQETLSRTFARLRERGLLETEGRRLRLPNPMALAEHLRRRG